MVDIVDNEAARCDAGKVATNVETAEEANVEDDTTKAAEVSTNMANYSCELCDSNFKNFRALRVHEGRVHKANGYSPIPQLDGETENVSEVIIYTFVSDFATEDIEITLREIFPDDVETEIIARAKLGGMRSAEHLCTVSVSSFLLTRDVLGQR